MSSMLRKGFLWRVGEMGLSERVTRTLGWGVVSGESRASKDIQSPAGRDLVGRGEWGEEEVIREEWSQIADGFRHRAEVFRLALSGRRGSSRDLGQSYDVIRPPFFSFFKKQE